MNASTADGLSRALNPFAMRPNARIPPPMRKPSPRKANASRFMSFLWRWALFSRANDHASGGDFAAGKHRAENGDAIARADGVTRDRRIASLDRCLVGQDDADRPPRRAERQMICADRVDRSVEGTSLVLPRIVSRRRRRAGRLQCDRQYHD